MVALFYISKFLSESSVIFSREARGFIVNYFLHVYIVLHFYCIKVVI